MDTQARVCVCAGRGKTVQTSSLASRCRRHCNIDQLINQAAFHYYYYTQTRGLKSRKKRRAVASCLMHNPRVIVAALYPRAVHAETPMQRLKIAIQSNLIYRKNDSCKHAHILSSLATCAVFPLVAHVLLLLL